MFYKKDRWTNISNCRIKMTFNQPHNGNDGGRYALFGVFQEKSSGKICILVNAHLCITWCWQGCTTCIGDQREGHLKDVLKIIKTIEDLRKELQDKFGISKDTIVGFAGGDLNIPQK